MPLLLLWVHAAPMRCAAKQTLNTFLFFIKLKISLVFFLLAQTGTGVGLIKVKRHNAKHRMPVVLGLLVSQ